MQYIYGWNVLVNENTEAALNFEGGSTDHNQNSGRRTTVFVDVKPSTLIVFFFLVIFLLSTTSPMSINTLRFYETITFVWYLFTWIIYDI